MTDTALQVAARYIDSELIQPLRQQLIGRKLVSRNPSVKGPGVYNVDVHTITEMNAAEITFKLPGEEANRDMIRVARANKNIPVLHKEFMIPRQDFDAYKNKGIALDTAAAQSAAQVVGVAEDELIINGWKPDGTTYLISGLYQGAGNDYSTQKDFGTPGNPTDAVAGAMALIEADYGLAEAYNLVLNPTQANELRASRNANGVLELPEVVDLLNLGNKNGPGRIFSTPAITAGKGLLAPVDPSRRFIELYIPQDMKTILGVDSKLEETSPIYGSVYELVYPHIKQSNALAKLSDI